MFVGETFEFACGGREGYWHFNGILTGHMGPTYFGTATENLDGIFTCTNEEGTISYSRARIVVYGECVGELARNVLYEGVSVYICVCMCVCVCMHVCMYI